MEQKIDGRTNGFSKNEHGVWPNKEACVYLKLRQNPPYPWLALEFQVNSWSLCTMFEFLVDLRQKWEESTPNVKYL